MGRLKKAKKSNNNSKQSTGQKKSSTAEAQDNSVPSTQPHVPHKTAKEVRKNFITACKEENATEIYALIEQYPEKIFLPVSLNRNYEVKSELFGEVYQIHSCSIGNLIIDRFRANNDILRKIYDIVLAKDLQKEERHHVIYSNAARDLHYEFPTAGQIILVHKDLDLLNEVKFHTQIPAACSCESYRHHTHRLKIELSLLLIQYIQNGATCLIEKIKQIVSSSNRIHLTHTDGGYLSTIDDLAIDDYLKMSDTQVSSEDKRERVTRILDASLAHLATEAFIKRFFDVDEMPKYLDADQLELMSSLVNDLSNRYTTTIFINLIKKYKYYILTGPAIKTILNSIFDLCTMLLRYKEQQYRLRSKELQDKICETVIKLILVQDQLDVSEVYSLLENIQDKLTLLKYQALMCGEQKYLYKIISTFSKKPNNDVLRFIDSLQLDNKMLISLCDYLIKSKHYEFLYAIVQKYHSRITDKQRSSIFYRSKMMVFLARADARKFEQAVTEFFKELNQDNLDDAIVVLTDLIYQLLSLKQLDKLKFIIQTQPEALLYVKEDQLLLDELLSVENEIFQLVITTYISQHQLLDDADKIHAIRIRDTCGFYPHKKLFSLLHKIFKDGAHIVWNYNFKQRHLIGELPFALEASTACKLCELLKKFSVENVTWSFSACDNTLLCDFEPDSVTQTPFIDLSVDSKIHHQNEFVGLISNFFKTMYRSVDKTQSSLHRIRLLDRLHSNQKLLVALSKHLSQKVQTGYKLQHRIERLSDVIAEITKTATINLGKCDEIIIQITSPRFLEKMEKLYRHLEKEASRQLDLQEVEAASSFEAETDHTSKLAISAPEAKDTAQAKPKISASRQVPKLVPVAKAPQVKPQARAVIETEYELHEELTKILRQITEWAQRDDCPRIALVFGFSYFCSVLRWRSNIMDKVLKIKFMYADNFCAHNLFGVALDRLKGLIATISKLDSYESILNEIHAYVIELNQCVPDKRPLEMTIKELVLLKEKLVSAQETTMDELTLYTANGLVRELVEWNKLTFMSHYPRLHQIPAEQWHDLRSIRNDVRHRFDLKESQDKLRTEILKCELNGSRLLSSGDTLPHSIFAPSPLRASAAVFKPGSEAQPTQHSHSF